MPLVTVVIPTHNRANYLIDALKSVFNQTLQDFEVIVIDDGSTDGTAEAIKSHYPDSVRYLKQERSGPGAARNRGILMANGKYIAFLDSDDLWASDKLERQVAHMEAHPNVVMTFTDFSRNERPGVDIKSCLHKSVHVNSGDIFLPLLKENFVVTPSVMVRQDVLARVGLFESHLVGMEDYEFWLRVANEGNIDYLAEVLTFVREHEERTTRTIAFWRDSVHAVSMVYARWSSNPHAIGLLRKQLGKTYHGLAYAERSSGGYRAAAMAFFESFRYGERRVASLLRAIVFGLIPHQLIDIIKPHASANCDCPNC